MKFASKVLCWRRWSPSTPSKPVYQKGVQPSPSLPRRKRLKPLHYKHVEKYRVQKVRLCYRLGQSFNLPEALEVLPSEYAHQAERAWKLLASPTENLSGDVLILWLYLTSKPLQSIPSKVPANILAFWDRNRDPCHGFDTYIWLSQENRNKYDFLYDWILQQPKANRQSSLFYFLEAMMLKEPVIKLGSYIQRLLQGSHPFLNEIFDTASDDDLASLLSTYIERTEPAQDEKTAHDQCVAITSILNFIFVPNFEHISSSRLENVFSRCAAKLSHQYRPLCLWMFITFTNNSDYNFLDHLITTFKSEDDWEYGKALEHVIYGMIQFVADEFWKGNSAAYLFAVPLSTPLEVSSRSRKYTRRAVRDYGDLFELWWNDETAHDSECKCRICLKKVRRRNSKNNPKDGRRKSRRNYNHQTSKGPSPIARALL